MITEKEIEWMAQNGNSVTVMMKAHQQDVSESVYVKDTMRAIVQAGKCIEITGAVTPTSLDNFEFEPQVGWSAGQLRRAGFVKEI